MQLFYVLLRMVAAFAIALHTLALLAAPTHVEAWGYNAFGQASPPLRLDVVAIAGGSAHSLALLSDSTVVAWGNNSQGQGSVPAGLSNVVAIAARTHNVALKSDGTVFVWGDTQPAISNVPPGLKASAIAAGNGSGNPYVLALRSNGTLIAWGINSATNVPADIGGLMAVAAGYTHGLGLKSNGTVVAWGDNFRGATDVPPGLTNVVALEAGQFDSYAIRADGTVVRWGDDFGMPLLTNVTSVKVGAQFGMALRRDGTVIGWGTFGDAGQNTTPPHLTDVTAIAAGDLHNLVLTPRPLLVGITPPVYANVGDTVTFTVSAIAGPFTFAWKHNGVAIAGETNASLVLSNVQAADAGTYEIAVSNPYGTAVTSTSLSFAPPTIVTQPQSQTVYRGESVAFSVDAAGSPPFTYVWGQDGTPVPGGTNSVLLLTNVRSNHAGKYQVVVRDAAGGATTSVVANLTVRYPFALGTNVMTLLPVIDTSIFSSGVNPAGNTTLLAGTRRNGVRDRALLRFDLSSLPANATIQSAVVRLTMARVPSSPVNSFFTVSRMFTPWTADATWSTASAGVPWATPGGLPGTDYSNAPSATTFVTGYGNYDFGPSPELLSDLEAWRGASAQNYGWLLKSESEQLGRTARHFGSSESANPPRLLVSFTVPPPAAELGQVMRSSNALTFNFSGQPGWIYRVESRTNVAQGIWTTVTNAPAGAATNPILISIPIDKPQDFLRVIAE